MGEWSHAASCIDKFRVVYDLQPHRSESIDMFRVYDFHEMVARDIDGWLSFVLAKKVEHLDLDFLEYWPPGSKSRLYTFPCSLFTGDRVSSVKCLYLNGCILRPPPGFDCFKSLTTLSLKHVYLTEDVIDNFLSNCSLLEHLCVEGAKTLVSLKVMVESVRLKYLEVYDCSKLKNIKVYATNLVSFKYEGPKISLSLECCQHLVDIYCGVHYGTCKDRISYIVGQYRSCLSHLNTLTMELSPMEVAISSKILPTFNNLKLLWRDPNINHQKMKYVSECVPE